ncbi:MAG: hypothetical protein ACYCW6_13315 [Candidatus Xenobia bacterium]
MIAVRPTHLQLFGGPGSSPFGELTAQVEGIENFSLQWSSSHPKLILDSHPGDSTRVTVGAYEPLEATVTVWESRTGASARATVTVLVLDAGMMP